MPWASWAAQLTKSKKKNTISQTVKQIWCTNPSAEGLEQGCCWKSQTWGFILGAAIARAAMGSKLGPPKPPRGTPPIWQQTKHQHHYSPKRASVSYYSDWHSQMGRGWASGEARLLAAILRRHWLERAVIEPWTRQESLLQDRNATVKPRHGSRTTHKQTPQSETFFFFLQVYICTYISTRFVRGS